jgi:alanine racemase
MRRYGVLPDELPSLIAAVDQAGCVPCRFMIHPPLITEQYPESAAIAEVGAWLVHVPQGALVSVSHLSPSGIGALVAAHGDQRFELRLGTALWLGDKHMVQLNADVLDVRPVRAETTAGYRGAVVPSDGHLVMVSAGSAHGVAPLTDGRSPFHFARQRLTLLEPPHMHTSMVFVPAGQECPGVGDRVDVQRPLITTAVDEVEWA